MKRKINSFIKLIAVFHLIFLSSHALATLDLSTDLTVDNGFDLYISTDDSVLGTLVGGNDSWPTVSHFDVDLTDGVTNYIHIVSRDWGVIGGVLGDFTLNNTDFEFANGSQDLLTNTTDWNVSMTGFGSGYTTPISYGTNGVGPWGFRGGIDSAAEWIWDPSGCVHCTAYFSTAITWVGSTSVSEPSSAILLGLSVLSAGFIRRRVSRKQMAI